MENTIQFLRANMPDITGSTYIYGGFPEVISGDVMIVLTISREEQVRFLSSSIVYYRAEIEATILVKKDFEYNDGTEVRKNYELIAFLADKISSLLLTWNQLIGAKVIGKSFQPYVAEEHYYMGLVRFEVLSYVP